MRSSSCAPSSRSPSRPRTSSRASPLSSRNATRSGKDAELMATEENSTEEKPTSLLPGTVPLADLTAQLHERRAKAKLGGGEEKIAKQHDRGKLTARERIDLLVDEVTFVEMGIHARPHS